METIGEHIQQRTDHREGGDRLEYDSVICVPAAYLSRPKETKTGLS